ncbi:Oidioi.mRNA.OKI2018_I69.chr1.g1425.t1.cds [Oikopleura dioica]|uniref:Oidioi.mRNA.OKI2018_I69.chr1.g1425.t1.cds n=1 Tax=Oikopleura dioica TaxID=34765 RepID=A0ABN7SX34_OIKDI|nr:Oidioi.mRNA.OKI2018_I69.chr1.g1425.t1.cds [Oikopleura dioica]
MRLLASIFAIITAYEQPKYGDFLQALGGMITDADVAELRQSLPCDARSDYVCPYSENFKPRTHEIKEGLKTCKDGYPLETSGRIVGGIEADHTRWPWYVRLNFFAGDHFAGYCGGSIVRENWVLTAAHCCLLRHNKTGPQVDYVDAYFNDPDRIENDNEGEFWLNASRTHFFNHHDYTNETGDGTHQADICLIKFKENIIAKGEGKAKEVCLADYYPEHGEACWVGGFGGLGSEGPGSKKFKSAGVSIMSQAYCNMKSNYTGRVPPHDVRTWDICAGLPDQDLDGWTDGAKVGTEWVEGQSHQFNENQFKNGTDACQGDSGGPLKIKIVFGCWHFQPTKQHETQQANTMKPAFRNQL